MFKFWHDVSDDLLSDGDDDTMTMNISTSAGTAPVTTSDAAVREVRHLADALRAEVQRVIAGQDHVVDTAIATLLASGHLLIEDVPGVGKTLMAQALSAALGGSFHRIQGTPDLLPGDVTGAMVPSHDGFEFRFRPGPVFANVVVFDELNRASPRTQSALLEVAEEATVTVDGDTLKLPDPFILIATQNPFEMAGTYALGEGALDRFTAVVTSGRPSIETEVEVLTGRRGRNLLGTVEVVAGLDTLVRARHSVADVHVDDEIARYVAELLAATREHPRARLGASTRGGVALVGLARAHAAMNGRSFVVPDDIARLTVVALAHRVLVAGGDGSTTGGRSVVQECLERVRPPGA